MFEKIEINTYRRQGKKEGRGSGWDLTEGPPGRRKRYKWRQAVRARDVAGQLGFLAAAFFLGQSVLLGELYPFGAALVAAGFAFNRVYAPVLLLGGILGLSTVVSGWDLTVRVLSLTLVAAAAAALPSRSAGLRLLLGTAVFAVLALTGVIYVTAAGAATTYDYVRVLFEAVFAALLTAAYYGALQGLRRLLSQNRVSAEELFYLALLLISVMAGAGQLQWWGVSPGGVLMGLAVLLAAYTGGAGLGAGAGAVLGVLPGLVFMAAPTAAVSTLAFAGFLGGLCRNLGRLGVMVGFLLGQALLNVYLGQTPAVAIVLLECAAASLVFLLLPRALLTLLHQYLAPALPWSAAGVGGFGDWQRALSDLTCAYDQVCGSAEVLGPADRGWRAAINELKSYACSDCALFTACWERDGDQTYTDLETCFRTAESKGRVALEDPAQRLRLRCARIRELLLGVNCLQRHYQMNRYWENKLRDNRELIADQLRGMSEIISRMGGELELQGDQWQGRADFFKQELKRAGFPVVALALYPGAGGNLEIEVTLPACNGSGHCRYDLIPLLSTLTGVPMAPAVWDCVLFDREDFCRVRYYPGLRYGLRLGIAQSSGSGDNLIGDHYALLPMSGGRLALMVSDGMGTGQTASKAAQAVISLLQRLLKVGFDHHLAMRILNSVMIKQFTDESFATVDLCLLDLVGGKVEITKIGAPPSYHLSHHQVEIIGASGTLPVGVRDELNLTTVTKVLAAGDLLVQVTDGVTDVYRDEAADNQENWIETVLREIVDLPPQEVADLILRLAQSGSRGAGRHQDDMTVLAAKVIPQNTD